jgi:pilus assembly protein Flp/PilA
MKSLINRFVKDESGATAIEYGLIAAGVAVAVVAIFGTKGAGIDKVLSDMFAAVSAKIPTS